MPSVSRIVVHSVDKFLHRNVGKFLFVYLFGDSCLIHMVIGVVRALPSKSCQHNSKGRGCWRDIGL